MKEVKKFLSDAFVILAQIAKSGMAAGGILRQEVPDQSQLKELMSSMTKLNLLIEDALSCASDLVEVTVYAIGKEGDEIGHFNSFTHGPVPPELREMLAGSDSHMIGDLEDGDCLVRMVSIGQVIKYHIEAVWMEGKWVTEDEEPVVGELEA